jgi:hypothetical protein
MFNPLEFSGGFFILNDYFENGSDKDCYSKERQAK